MWSSPEQRSSGKLGFANLVPLNCTREMAEVAAMGQSVSVQNLEQPVSRREFFRGRRPVQVATWNVRSLVESAGGDPRICRSRPRQAPEVSSVVDRKLDLMVNELRRYRVSVAAIQETKWYGSDVWEAQGYTFLHSGRVLPVGEGPAVRNEGVGIALDERAAAAWKEAGKVWKAVSSRIIMARLKLISVGQRRAGGSRETKSTYISILSVYAPTAKAPPATKQKFMEDLQDVVNEIPTSDVMLFLGDLNARVGSAIGSNDVWRGVRGRHGVGRCNEAGEKLLEFCSLNQLTIMNTWFEKKRHHLTTWKHPATKESHMIDYVIMRADQRVLCVDVQVMRGANCWSDHSMVRAKVIFRLPHLKKVSPSTLPLAVHTLRRVQNRQSYEECVKTCLTDQPHDSNKPVSDNWEILKSCIISAAETAVGRGRKKQPDWFLDAVDTLQPLLDQKNAAYSRFLQANSVATKKEFRKHQRAVKHAVDAAKEEWISKVSGEAEKARKDGRQRWMYVRQLQMAFRGRRPRRPAALRKENGELTTSLEEVEKRWHSHFSKILKFLVSTIVM